MTVLGYGTDRFPGFYLHDSGHPAPWRVDTPARGGGGAGRAARARHRRRGPWWWRTRCRSPSSSTPGCTTACWPAALAAAADGGRERQGDHALPARLLPPRDRRREPRRERAARDAQRASWRRGSRRRRRRLDARWSCSATSWWTSSRGSSGPVAVGSDSAARIAVARRGVGGQRGGVAGGGGRAPVLVGRVGADERGRGRRDELRAAGVERGLAVDGERPTGTCIVLVAPGGERSMLPDAGANDALAPDDLPAALLARGRPPARGRLRAAARGLASRRRWRRSRGRGRAG